MVGPEDLRLTLVLSPTQFAGGREAEVVKSWGIVDRILTPGQGTRLALGMRGLEVGPQTALVHLGGDLYFSARVARRLRAPAGAFAETSFIVRRHQAFARIFAASETLAQELRARGVPKERIVVTGDPRVDAVLDGAHLPSPSRGAIDTSDSLLPTAEGTDAVVSIFAGSRDRYFRTLLPYFMATADELAAKRPGVTFQVIAA
jgi:hypothetical protein